MKQFDNIKQRAKLNIDSIKSIAELYSTIQQNLQSGNVVENKKVQHVIDLVKKSVDLGGEVVFKDNKWIILIPKNFESSKVFGQDTNWCTTSSDGYYYNRYKNDYGGEYFINVNLQDGSLYQFHFESNQFMDSSDNRINMDKFSSENPKLVTFYKEILEKTHKPKSKEERINEFRQDETRMKELFSDVKDAFYSERSGFTGRMDFDDINSYEYTVYDEGRRECLSIDTIQKVLSGDTWDLFDFSSADYSLNDTRVNTKSNNKILSEVGITWDDIMNIYNGNYDEVKMNRDMRSEIQDLLSEDFYIDMGVDSVIADCNRSGSEAAMINDVTYDLKHNLPLDSEEPLLIGESAYNLNIKLSSDDIHDIIGRYLDEVSGNTSSGNSDLNEWYEQYVTDIDDDYYHPTFIWCWRDLHFNYPEFTIYEPQYGWNDFDEGMWSDAQETFCKKVVDIAKRYKEIENRPKLKKW